VNALFAEVLVMEPTGSMTEFVLRKGGGRDFVATFADRIDLRSGEPVSFVVAPESVKVFEPDSSDQERN